MHLSHGCIIIIIHTVTAAARIGGTATSTSTSSSSSDPEEPYPCTTGWSSRVMSRSPAMFPALCPAVCLLAGPAMVHPFCRVLCLQIVLQQDHRIQPHTYQPQYQPTHPAARPAGAPYFCTPSHSAAAGASRGVWVQRAGRSAGSTGPGVPRGPSIHVWVSRVCRRARTVHLGHKVHHGPGGNSGPSTA